MANYRASRVRCQIHLNTAEAKPILGGAKLDVKKSEVAAVGSLASITPR